MYTQRTEFSLIFFVCFMLRKLKKKNQHENEQKIIQNQRDPKSYEERNGNFFLKKVLNEIFEIKQINRFVYYVDDDNNCKNDE